MSEVFESICRMSQQALKSYVGIKLLETHADVVTGDGFVYAQGKFPVLLVAHLDTVHKNLPNDIIYNTYTKEYSSPNGIGGDDRCGVYMILEIIKKYNCSVLFCEDEESGAVGAKKFTQTELSKNLSFNYIIEFDRQGKNDAVFYWCANDEFEKFITKEHFKTAYGTFSDISVIAPHLGCAAVNLSCGYYKAHTTDEYVIFSQMERNIGAACNILERTEDGVKFEYVEASYGGRYGSYGGYGRAYSYDDYYGYNDYRYDEENYYVFEYADANGKTQWYDLQASSYEEAVGKFCIENPSVPYDSIIGVDAYSADEETIGWR